MNTFCAVIFVVLGAAHAGVIGPAALYGAPGHLAYSSLVAPVVSHASVVVPAGHGLEGQYVPDLTEKLYDDGSYKPQLEAVPLAPSPYGLTVAGSGLEGQYVPQAEAVKLSPSPYGLTPAGSGLEGAYVPDHSEHLYDDGSYKPGLYEHGARLVQVAKVW